MLRAFASSASQLRRLATRFFAGLVALDVALAVGSAVSGAAAAGAACGAGAAGAGCAPVESGCEGCASFRGVEFFSLAGARPKTGTSPNRRVRRVIENF